MTPTPRLPLAFLVAVLVPVATWAQTTNPALERNKAVARKVLEEVLGQGRIAENEALYAPAFVAHGDSRDVGRAEDREAVRGWRAAFPDGRITVTHVLAEGELVTVRYTGEGTNTGAGAGLPATGKRVKVSGITIFRITNGQIAEEWTSYNQAELLRQLGLLPSASPK